MSTNISNLVTAGNARFDVAAAIRAHAAVRRISDSALGREIGMSQSKISRRMNGEIAFDTDDLGRIANYLGVSVVELIQMPTAAQAPRPGGGAGARAIFFGVGPAGIEPTTSTVESRRFAGERVAEVIDLFPKQGDAEVSAVS